jgi:hypothetical protein
VNRFKRGVKGSVSFTVFLVAVFSIQIYFIFALTFKLRIKDEKHCTTKAVIKWNDLDNVPDSGLLHNMPGEASHGTRSNGHITNIHAHMLVEQAGEGR